MFLIHRIDFIFYIRTALEIRVGEYKNYHKTQNAVNANDRITTLLAYILSPSYLQTIHCSHCAIYVSTIIWWICNYILCHRTDCADGPRLGSCRYQRTYGADYDRCNSICCFHFDCNVNFCTTKTATLHPINSKSCFSQIFQVIWTAKNFVRIRHWSIGLHCIGRHLFGAATR